MLGLPHCIGFSLVAPSGGHFPVMAQGLLTVVASPVAEHRPQEHTGFSGCGAGPGVVVPSCSQPQAQWL